MAIAGAVLHELATHTLALAFFATHYGSLADDFAHAPSIRNMHMSTLVDDEKCEVSSLSRLTSHDLLTASQLVFLYKLVQGAAASSFGTHVARLAGVPEPVVARADTDFVRQFAERMAGRKKTAASRLPAAAQADFAYIWRVASGEQEMPEDEFRKKEVLDGIMGAMRGLLLKS
jgi:DNA mismatch repair protein MSH6